MVTVLITDSVHPNLCDLTMLRVVYVGVLRVHYERKLRLERRYDSDCGRRQGQQLQRVCFHPFIVANINSESEY